MRRTRGEKLEKKTGRVMGYGLSDLELERETREHMEKVLRNGWRLTISLRAGHLQVPGCVCLTLERATSDQNKLWTNIRN
jgi:hypothetical protein